MDVLDMVNPLEQFLCQKATQMKRPIGMTMELLPICNMDCRMCYVRMDAGEMSRQGGILSADQWMERVEPWVKKGVLFALLTGGEPLLHPEFKEIYGRLKKLGVIVCINTNGTLINEDMADFLAQDPPRRVNISIYGASNETYGSLCSLGDGFDRMMRGVNLLKARGIDVKWNYSVTTLNCMDANDIYRLPLRTRFLWRQLITCFHRNAAEEGSEIPKDTG